MLVETLPSAKAAQYGVLEGYRGHGDDGKLLDASRPSKERKAIALDVHRD
jgi:hypothetical protein